MRLQTHEVESWIKALPLADVSETRHRVSISLVNLIASDLPGQERYAALELFRSPIHYLSEALQHHFVGASFPLTLKARGTADQLSELHMTMAEGYQSVADDLLDLNTVRQDFTMLATSLHRSLYYLGQALLTSYQLYETYSADCWRRIHRIYEAAERKGVHSSTVHDPYRRHRQSTSIAEQYKQILLLALTNPYRYSQNDIRSIYSLLEYWTPRCRLLPAVHVEALQFACRVDLASDEPPSSIAYGALPHPATCRLLDTSALIQSLQDSLPPSGNEASNQASETQPPQTTIRWKDLLHSLATAWGPTAKRRYSRTHAETTDIAVSLGLSTIHPLIDEPNSMSAMQSSGTGRRFPTSTVIDDCDSFMCEVMDESAGGSRLKWRNINKGKIRVGELIALRQTRAPGEMPGIAAIRWLKNTSKHTVEFGIQMISPDAFPITVRHYNANDQESDHDYLKGLYIPEFKALRQPASLILPAFLYRADDVISLVMDHQEHCLQLVKAIEATQGFSRFYFSSLATSRDHH
jgi:hypothetical protein